MAGERYTIPAMGGVEVELSSLMGETAIVRVPQVGSVMLPKDALEPVKAPLPAEPPKGCGLYANGLMWWHGLHGWKTSRGTPARTWAYLIENYRDRWPEQWQVLIPDPFGEPTPLPWRVNDLIVDRSPWGGGQVDIKLSLGPGNHHVFVTDRQGTSDLIRALWSATQASEEEPPF